MNSPCSAPSLFINSPFLTDLVLNGLHTLTLRELGFQGCEAQRGWLNPYLICTPHQRE